MNEINQAVTAIMPTATQRTRLLNKGEAERLFHQEAIYVGECDAIPHFRVVELFGEKAANYGKGLPNQMGKTYNIFGLGNGKEYALTIIYKEGFLRAVSFANAEIIVAGENAREEDKTL